MFDTLGEFVRKPLNEYVFDAEIIKRIEMAVGEIKGHKKHIHYFSIGQGRDGYEITCIPQGKNETKLKEGTYRAHIFNCDKPELSKFEEITVASIRNLNNNSFAMLYFSRNRIQALLHFCAA